MTLMYSATLERADKTLKLAWANLLPVYAITAYAYRDTILDY